MTAFLDGDRPSKAEARAHRDAAEAARLINPVERPGTPVRESPAEPVLWHVALFAVGATALCMALATLILGDLTMALTVSATILAAFAVKAFRTFHD